MRFKILKISFNLKIDKHVLDFVENPDKNQSCLVQLKVTKNTRNH
jgi:hypothetical protein